MPKPQRRPINKDLEKYEGKYIIPIMGPTGTGKSTFINALAGTKVVEVGSGLSSCTKDLQAVEISDSFIRSHAPEWAVDSPSGARSLIIVDTPGFNHTDFNDFEVLGLIAEWLADTYGARARLAGVIYLLDIAQRTVTATTQRNFEVFDKLCGEDACNCVVLGTIGWENIPATERAKAESRELELKDKFWGDMIRKGSSLQRVDQESSPWDMVQRILYEERSPLLQIQKELVELEKKLPQTQAALALRKSAGGSSEDVRVLEQKIQALKEKLLRFRRLFR